MPEFYMLFCETCGQRVATDEKTKQYDHWAKLYRGRKYDHSVVKVTTVKTTELHKD